MKIIASYRGPGKTEMFSTLGDANRLLLATHNRLLWCARLCLAGAGGAADEPDVPV